MTNRERAEAAFPCQCSESWTACDRHSAQNPCYYWDEITDFADDVEREAKAKDEALAFRVAERVVRDLRECGKTHNPTSLTVGLGCFYDLDLPAIVAEEMER